LINITPIPALDSNYFWVIRPDPRAPSVYVVDPGAAALVIDYLQQRQLELGALLITHRHNDHTGGINALLERWPVSVYGPDSPQIPQITHILQDGDQLDLGQLHFEIIGLPGHTREHIAYYLPTSSEQSTNPPSSALKDPVIFCGDALFAAGCGRMFDGPAEVMWASLMKLAALPDNTQVYCAHEYTLPNLTFAQFIEPDNRDITRRLEQVTALRANNGISLPTTIALEKRTNPFLRCQHAGVKSAVERLEHRPLNSYAEVFASLRKAKDNW
jgi:hydroxyacylglutathione hydrolase